MENIVNSTIALYKAYRKTRCGKRDNPTAMRYRMEAIERTVALSERLQRRDYSFGPYYPFKVYEPKERLVLAIDFEGKVVQHSLCDNVLEPAFSRRFIRDNYAGQIGIGFHTYLTQTGKVVRKVRAKSIDNMKRKIRKFRGLVDSGKMTLDSVVQSYASWTGHISHGNTYHLRQNMDAYFFSYFPELKPSPKGDTTHGPKTEQPRKQVEGQVRQPVRQPDRLDRGR